MTHGWREAEPFEVVLCIVSFIAAGIVLATGQFPGTVSVSLPLALQYAWAALLFLGALLTLIGLFAARTFIRAAPLEVCGLACIGVVTGTYTAALLVSDPASTGIAASISFSYCLGCAMRAARLAQRLRKVRAALRGEES